MSSAVRVLRFVRFSHTVFALPFALGSTIVAARGIPSARIALLIVVCMVLARTSAMLFNRIADWEIDKRNPRTENRHTLVARPVAIALLILSSLAFIVAAGFINRLVFLLSPVALAIVFFYSLTKRFTSYSHLFLGLALAVAPVGAWLAVTGALAPPPLFLAASVLLWVAGFDIIYATQDYDFDLGEGLHSLVVNCGVPGSLRLAQRMHWAMLAGLAGFGGSAKLGPFYYASLILIFAALIYEHRSASSHDLQAINRAFFTSNAWVGAIFLVGTSAAVFWPLR